MRIAVFHNFMDNIGGAEIVTLTLARELNADVYTTVVARDKIEKMGFGDVFPRIKSIGSVPKLAPWRQQLALWKFRRLNLSGQYDFFIIAGDWAMSAAVNNKPNIWYVHSPLNEIWAFRDHIRTNLLAFWKRPFYDTWVWLNRKITVKYSKYIDTFICNSQNTASRLKRYYGIDSTVIYPPIDTKKYKNEKSSGYWLSVNRLAEHKRIGMQLKAFSNLPDERLIIVGSYEKDTPQFESEREAILKVKPDNVEMLSWVSDNELIDLYSKAKGFITTSLNEDFGMTAVEAMASGKPVIAPREGGYRESVTHNETGTLIDCIDARKLAESVKILSLELAQNSDKYRETCKAQAKQFDTTIFIQKIKENVICQRDNRRNLQNIQIPC